ncbi:MAG: tryptophan 7-halogenase [Hellea sp.]
MSHPPLQKILICGGGLASYMCAVALSRVMPPNIGITLIETPHADKTDVFFGTVTSPTSYNFLLNNGITEPELFPATNTAFSLGTRYVNWGKKNLSWTQSFHLPLPLFNGVELHHYLNRQHSPSATPYSLEAYIMSVQAANEGGFAHPPEERKTPLADMEYGYQFLPQQWSRVFADNIASSPVSCIDGSIKTIGREGENIQSVTLNDGRVIEADFIIDCLGADSALPSTSNTRTSERRLRAVTSFNVTERLGEPLRNLTAKDYGWQADTPLQDGQHRITVYDPANETDALKDHGTPDSEPIEALIGKTSSPWTGNCLKLGHGAAILEPLTPAPILLLQRDIDRLIELIPVSTDMAVERREYNRRFTADYEHAELFQDTLLKTIETPNEPYWASAETDPISEKLANKITQFESRGIGVQYDFEPFEKHDWIMLHFGMGRRPVRYDPLADRIAVPQMEQTLDRMRNSIAMMARKVPPHNHYMTRLLNYLKDQDG